MDEYTHFCFGILFFIVMLPVVIIPIATWHEEYRESEDE